MALVLSCDLAYRQDSKVSCTVTSLCPTPPSGLLSQVLAESAALFLSLCLSAEGGTSSPLITVGSLSLAQVPTELTLNIYLRNYKFKYTVNPIPLNQEVWKMYLSPRVGQGNTHRTKNCR